MSQPDSNLIERATGGDRVALSQLLLLHYDALYQHVESRISDDLQGLMRADDVLQQTFVRAAQAVGTFHVQQAGSFRGWLWTIADNLLRDAEKRRRRERRFTAFFWRGTGSDVPAGAAGAIDQMPDSLTSPSRRAQASEAVRRMQAALAELPEDQRDVLRRRYLWGQSIDQIAAGTGRTRDAVRGLCYRARQNVRAAMGRSSLYFTR